MPELPEVETTKRGVAPWCLQQDILELEVWQPSLRWPVPAEISDLMRGQTILEVERRGKYLVFGSSRHSLLVHLGMSGSLRICDLGEPRRKHDHWQIILSGGRVLRYHDPRRFGALLVCPTAELARHPLLAKQGIEPLTPEFDGHFLFERSRGRKQAVKNFIMDGRILVGVGNIYAAESLFTAGIHPARAAGRISELRYQALAESIQKVLNRAIESGGTTLRDYVNGSGQPGYFAQELSVYNRQAEPCPRCSAPVKSVLLGQRTSYYCAVCQR